MQAEAQNHQTICVVSEHSEVLDRQMSHCRAGKETESHQRRESGREAEFGNQSGSFHENVTRRDYGIRRGSGEEAEYKR